jgi:hypothetical protein
VEVPTQGHPSFWSMAPGKATERCRDDVTAHPASRRLIRYAGSSFGSHAEGAYMARWKSKRSLLATERVVPWVLWLFFAASVGAGAWVAYWTVTTTREDREQTHNSYGVNWEERGQRGDFWGGHLAAGAGAISVFLLIAAALLQLLEHYRARKDAEQARLGVGTTLLLDQLKFTSENSKYWKYFYGDANGHPVPLSDLDGENERVVLKALAETLLTHLAVQMLVMARDEPYPRQGMLVVLLCRFRSSLVLGQLLEQTLHEFPVTGAAMLVAKEGSIEGAMRRMNHLIDTPVGSHVDGVRRQVLLYQLEILDDCDNFWDIVVGGYKRRHRVGLEDKIDRMLETKLPPQVIKLSAPGLPPVPRVRWGT